MSYGAARRALDMGRKLAELPATAAALMAGEITPSHAQVSTNACTPARAAALRELEPEMVAAAKKFTAIDLRRIVARVCDAIDGDDGAAAALELYDQRSLHVSPSFRGVGVLNGELDPEGTETVITALEKRMEDDPDIHRDKKRSRGQRRADALVDICHHYLTTSNTPATSRRRGRPNLSVIVDLNVLRGQGHTAIVDDIHSELEHVGHVSAATLQRLACDANISRILTDGQSQPLDVGRHTRTIPPHLWRAVVARDRHCTTHGCNIPPGWCEVHHIIPWQHGGPTTLENLELKCPRDHHAQHEGQARGP